jgi:DNA-binding MarR family transcriptional regulator
MRSNVPARFPVFRSRAQAEILAATLLHPERDQTITDMSRRLGIPLATVSDEASRLVRAGILATRKASRANLLRPIRVTGWSPR